MISQRITSSKLGFKASRTEKIALFQQIFSVRVGASMSGQNFGAIFFRVNSLDLGGSHRESYKKPGARPGFLFGALFAPLLPRVQRNANGVSFLPDRSFGTLERAADAPCGCLLPRHCLERAKVTLRPITTNFSSSTCHFN
jgi:hypothetical protein